MTQLPGPPQLPGHNAGEASRPRSPATGPSIARASLLGWFLLTLGVAIIIALHTLGGGLTHATTGGAGASPDPAKDPGTALKAVAKLMVGAKDAFSAVGGGLEKQVEQQLTEPAKTPIDKVRAAAALAETGSVPAAQSLLTDVLTDPALDAGLREDAQAMQTLVSVKEGPAREALTPEQRERLIKRHHWFAELALTRGLPDNDPERSLILKPAQFAVGVAVAAVFVIGAAMFVGFVLFIVAIVLLVNRKIRPAFDAQRTTMSAKQRASLLETIGLFILLLVGVSYLAEWLSDATGVELGTPARWLLLSVAFWPLCRGMSISQLRTSLGWHTGKGFFTEIGCGIAGYLAGLPIVLGGMVIMFVILSITKETPSHPVIEQLGQSGGWKTFVFFTLACLWAPVLEETFFRGAFFSHLRGFWSVIPSAVLVAFVFAAIHPQGWAVVPALMGLAISFAFIREWRGSLIGCMTAHAIHNAFTMTLAKLLLGD